MRKKRGPQLGPDGYEDTPPDVLEDMKHAVFIDNDPPTPEQMRKTKWTPYVWFHKDGTVSEGFQGEIIEDTK
jgi:hypothetical protein